MKQLLKDILGAFKLAYSNFLARRTRERFNEVTRNSEVFNAVKGTEDFKEDETGDLSNLDVLTRETVKYFDKNRTEKLTKKIIYKEDGRLIVEEV